MPGASSKSSSLPSKVRQSKINYAVKTRASSFEIDLCSTPNVETPSIFDPKLVVVDPISVPQPVTSVLPVVIPVLVPQHVIPCSEPVVVEPRPILQPVVSSPAQLLSKVNTSITVVETSPLVPQPTQKSGKKSIDHDPKILFISPSNSDLQKPGILPNGTSTPIKPSPITSTHTPSVKNMISTFEPPSPTIPNPQNPTLLPPTEIPQPSTPLPPKNMDEDTTTKITSFMQKEMQAQSTLIRSEIDSVKRDLEKVNNETIQLINQTFNSINGTLSSLKTKYEDLTKPDGILSELQALIVQVPPIIEQQKEVVTKLEEHRIKTAKNAHDINEILTKPDRVSENLIDQKNLIYNETRNREDYWQRRLNQRGNGLVFYNIPVTPGSIDSNPLNIFKEKVLIPLNLNHSDQALATPNTIVDTSKNIPDRKSHHFVCTFINQNCITIFKQHIRLLPKGIKFKASLPKEYQSTLNEYTKSQNHFRSLRNKDGETVKQARIEYAQGHIIFQLRDRIDADNHGPWQTFKSFIPSAITPIPSKTLQNIIFTTTLRAYNWSNPIEPVIQRETLDHLKKLKYIEHSSFNRSGHILNISLRTNENPDTIKNDLNQIEILKTATCTGIL